MHNMLAGLTVAAFVVALGGPAFAKTETVKGQLVDMFQSALASVKG